MKDKSKGRGDVPGFPDFCGVDRIDPPDPDDSISRLAKMHRQGVARDIDGMEVIPDDDVPQPSRCEDFRGPHFSLGDSWVALAFIGIVAGVFCLIVSLRDLVTTLGVR